MRLQSFALKSWPSLKIACPADRKAFSWFLSLRRGSADVAYFPTALVPWRPLVALRPHRRPCSPAAPVRMRRAPPPCPTCVSHSA